MTCVEFREVVRDYLREEWMSPAARAEAALHEESCPGCRKLAEREGLLSVGLQRLAGKHRQLTAPPAMKGQLLSAVRARGDLRRSRVPRIWYGAIAAAAALLLFTYVQRQPAETPAPTVAKTPRRPIVSAPPAIESVESTVAEVKSPRRLRAEPSAVRSARTPERVTEFLPLRYGRPLEAGEAYQVIRIQLPRAELLRLGLPVAPDSQRGSIQADVLLGGDGLAKGIRFVYE